MGVGFALLVASVGWMGWSQSALGPLALRSATASPDGQAASSGLSFAAPANSPEAGVQPPPGVEGPNQSEPESTPPHVAEIAPPVADRIQLDPSLFAPSDVPPIRQESPRRPGEHVPGVTRSVVRDHTPAAKPTNRLSTDALRVARRPLKPRADIAVSWPLPGPLVELLESIHQPPVALEWSMQVQEGLDRLHAIESLEDRSARQQLKQLGRLAEKANGIAARFDSLADRAVFLQASYALERRLAIWKPVHMLAAPMMAQVSLRDSDRPAMLDELRTVEQLVAGLDDAPAWRQYLLLDNVHAAAYHLHPIRAEERSQLARQVLGRIYSSNFSIEQQKFFETDVWQDFARQLRRWVSEPVSYRDLLDDLERFEQLNDEQSATRIAAEYQILRWSPIAGAVELGEQLNIHYRNANVRTAISDDFINRLLPEYDPIEEDVNDVLLGGRIFGRSRTSTRLRVVLIPDKFRWQFGLEAEGEVDSLTHTRRGPARFHNVGRARFLARKLLLIDRTGINSEEANAQATADANLARLETDFDGLPLVNVLARAIARQQYEIKAGEADWEIRGMVAGRASSQLDQEVERQINSAADQFRNTVHRPLVRLGLQPEAIDMQTTEDRLVARYRLAGDHQLAASTPRPQAPSNSLLSVQIHESAVNNLLTSLQLHGHKTELRSLYNEISDKLEREPVPIPDDVPEDVIIQFAKREPVRLRWDDNRIHITLRIAGLASGRSHAWRNLEVRATYGIVSDGLHVTPVRDGAIRLTGHRLSFRDQVALRAIFSKVFSQHPDLDLLDNRLVDDPRLRSLVVTQFIIRDGWIGLAIGEGKPANAHLADEGGRLRG
jgi:hypothetical protein